MGAAVPTTRQIHWPRLGAPVALVALAAISCALALAAASQPLLALVGLSALIAVVVCALRVDFALLLLVATAPLEALFPGGSGGGLTLTKIVGALCFISFALSAVVGRRRLWAGARTRSYSGSSGLPCSPRSLRGQPGTR